jgi:hypothetical protein
MPRNRGNVSRARFFTPRKCNGLPAREIPSRENAAPSRVRARGTSRLATRFPEQKTPRRTPATRFPKHETSFCQFYLSSIINKN